MQPSCAFLLESITPASLVFFPIRPKCGGQGWLPGLGGSAQRLLPPAARLLLRARGVQPVPAVSHLGPESFLFWLVLGRDMARTASDGALQCKWDVSQPGELLPVQAGVGEGHRRSWAQLLKHLPLP